MSLMIFTDTGAKALNPKYFRVLSQSEEGPSRVMLGRAMPVMSADYSFILVRANYRRSKQNLFRNGRGGLNVKSYTATARTDYIVATISWDTGLVTELTIHADKDIARADMKARHAAVCGHPSRAKESEDLNAKLLTRD